jgi:hypothetical protein
MMGRTKQLSLIKDSPSWFLPPTTTFYREDNINPKDRRAKGSLTLERSKQVSTTLIMPIDNVRYDFGYLPVSVRLFLEDANSTCFCSPLSNSI